MSISVKVFVPFATQVFVCVFVCLFACLLACVCVCLMEPVQKFPQRFRGPLSTCVYLDMHAYARIPMHSMRRQMRSQELVISKSSVPPLSWTDFSGRSWPPRGEPETDDVDVFRCTKPWDFGDYRLSRFSGYGFASMITLLYLFNPVKIWFEGVKSTPSQRQLSANVISNHFIEFWSEYIRQNLHCICKHLISCS